MNEKGKIENSGSWGWSDIKYVSIGIIVITIIISLFDFHPNLYFWFIEILRNLVISASISFTIFFLSIILRVNKVILKWSYFLLTTILFAFGGFLGGLIAWGINDLLFGFNITHPVFYFIITSALAIIFGLIVYGYISIQDKFKKTAAKLAEKEIVEQKLINLKTKAELEALRAKVNPHFFFNTLNSIASLIPENPEKAEEMVERLSHLFRYTLDTSYHELVKLSEEMEFINEYLEIEKVRLVERLNYKLEFDDKLVDFSIPGMLLQPLVENSIKHGISHLKRGGEISISCKKEDENCVIQIVDSGVGFDKSTITEGFGLNGVKERLNLHYKSRYDLKIDTVKGVKIILTLPMMN